MKINQRLYLIAAIGFILGSVFAFITYFTGDKTSSTWIILGAALMILSFPMIISFKKEITK